MAKKLVRLTENQLKQIVNESVKKILRENDVDNYFGGGLPDRFFDDGERPETDRISQKEIKQLNDIADMIADIANNTSDDAELLYQAINCIERFISTYQRYLTK